MSSRVFVASIGAAVLWSSAAAAVSVTNRDDKEYKVTVVEGDSKQDMVLNNYLPKMEIDAQTYRVRADGQLLTCEPATVLPLAQKYFLF